MVNTPAGAGLLRIYAVFPGGVIFLSGDSLGILRKAFLADDDGISPGFAGLPTHEGNEMVNVVISGTGVYTPPHAVSNEQLVAAFNHYVSQYNQRSAAAIAAGQRVALEPSSAEFIVKASGIRQRFLMDREGVLDPARMCPALPARDNEACSVQAEMAIAAARDALASASRQAADVDMVVVACAVLTGAAPPARTVPSAMARMAVGPERMRAFYELTRTSWPGEANSTARSSSGTSLANESKRFDLDTRRTTNTPDRGMSCWSARFRSTVTRPT